VGTFLLSPADCRGRRAEMLLRPGAAFPLALALQDGEATLGEVFAFVSQLYFRGKLAYGNRFGRVVRVIAPGRGLLDPGLRVSTAHVEAFSQVAVDAREPGYLGPLTRDAADLAAAADGPVVLLGSVATGKYVDPLRDVFGDRLRFPAAFAGQGDMRRGAMLLAAVRAGRELEYAPVPAGRRRRR
jgi:hypothetical protein